MPSKPKLSVGKVVRRLMSPSWTIALENQAISRNANRLRGIIAKAPNVDPTRLHISEGGVVNYFVGNELYQAVYDHKKRELKTFGTRIPPEVVTHITEFFPNAQKENKILPSTGTFGQDTTLSIHSWREITPTQLLLASFKAARNKTRGL